MKKISIIALAALFMASCGDNKSGSKVAMKTVNDSFSYAFGAIVGSEMFKQNNVKEINWEIFKTAVEKSMVSGDSGLAMSKETIYKVMNQYLTDSKYGKNKTEGEAYMSKIKKEGFTQTASGLMYKKIKGGNGVKPTITDTVLVYYTGKYVNGTTFDSNIGRPAYKTAMNSGAVEGFLEALALMDEGAEYEVVIPYQLGYGKTGYLERGMEPYQTLIFSIKLDSIKK
jgi:FKBP-type peptidyl-prolyl cis-trans isomerase